MKKLWLILLIISHFSHAQDLKEKDKQYHFIAGTVSSMVGYAYIYHKTEDPLKATLAGLGTALLVGTLKETYDSTQKHPNDKFDIDDLKATMLGSLTFSITVNLEQLFKKRKKKNEKLNHLNPVVYNFKYAGTIL